MTIDEIKLTIPEENRLPKYLALADALCDWIAVNRPEGGARLPSERNLAESCGTTPVTVAKSLNELVRKGFLERRAGSGTYIAKNRNFPGTLRIGIVAHEPIKDDNCYISDVLQTLYSYWQPRGADLLTLVRTPDQYEQTVREYNLAALVVLVPREDFDSSLNALIDKGFPLVSIGLCLKGIRNYSFGTEHEKVCEQAVAYLHSRGHRRIGLLNSRPQATSCMEREAGYLRGMWNAGLPVNPDWIIRGPFEEDLANETALVRQLTGPEPITALLLTGHFMILSFYDLAAQLAPPLTVFAQPVREFTAQAAEQLERLLRHEEPLPVVPSEAYLVERGSCRTISE